MTQLEKSLTPQDALAHYGVKVMKWGRRRSDTELAKASVGRSKPTNREIHDARARVGSQARQLNRQIDKTNLATGKQQKVEAKKLSEMSTSFLKNPDRATALRLTTGEKVTLSILAVGVPGIGTTAAGISAGSRVAARKMVERQQRNN